MKNCLLLLFLLALPAFHGMLNAQTDVHNPEIHLSGKIISQLDSSAIYPVAIKNTDKYTWHLIDGRGEYQIRVNKNDSLVIYADNYQTLHLSISGVWDSSEMMIYDIVLEPSSDFGSEIASSADYLKFRNDFLSLGFPHDPYQVDLQLPEKIPEMHTLYLAEFDEANIDMKMNSKGLVVTGAISALYDLLFNKRAKELRKFNRDLDNAKENNYLARQTAIQLLKDLIMTEDDALLDEFLAFCNFTDIFMQKADDDQVTEAVMECYNDFKSR